jgi:predicted DNA-binding transcriptional regulator AlpA
MNEYRSIKAVVEQFSITDETLRRWVKMGMFPKPIKVGRRVLFRVSDLIAFEAERVKAA